MASVSADENIEKIFFLSRRANFGRSAMDKRSYRNTILLPKAADLLAASNICITIML